MYYKYKVIYYNSQLFFYEQRQDIEDIPITDFQQAAKIIYCFIAILFAIQHSENNREMLNDGTTQPQIKSKQSEPCNKQVMNALVPIIPIKCELGMKMKVDPCMPSMSGYQHYPQEQKIIPGYNFQSLFRKKSHIRLARKKHKEEFQKRSTHVKQQTTEKQEKNIQKGHWTTQENKRYHWFLQIHSRHFIHKHLRRTDKIFKNMATFISTREAEQCRSHHQKMEKKYHTFYQILLKLRMDFYNTANPDQLKNDIEESGLSLKESLLITEEQLKNGDLKRQNRNEDDEEDSFNNSNSSDQHSSKQANNLLHQNYQKNFHIPY